MTKTQEGHRDPHSRHNDRQRRPRHRKTSSLESHSEATPATQCQTTIALEAQTSITGALGRLFGGSFAPYAFNAQSGIQVYFGHVDSWRTHSATYGEFVGTRSLPLKIIGSCLIEARILDAGSNPTLQSCVNFNVIELIEWSYP